MNHSVNIFGGRRLPKGRDPQVIDTHCPSGQKIRTTQSVPLLPFVAVWLCGRQ